MKINQCCRILNILMKRGRITSRTARSMGVTSLGARVRQLRLMGVKITTTKEGYRLSGDKPTPRQVEDFEDNLFPDYEP